MVRFRVAVVVAVVTSCCVILRAEQPLPSPRDIVARLEQTPQPAATAPAGSLEADLIAFGNDLPSLAPDVAATRWLDLLDRSSKDVSSRTRSRSYSYTPLAARAIDVIPHPELWNELNRQATRRLSAAAPSDKFRLTAVRMFTRALIGDAPGLHEDLRQLVELAMADSRQPMRVSQVRQIAQTLAQRDSDPARAVSQFETTLASLEKGEPSYEQLVVPDLVTLVGEEKARKLLRRALLIPQASMMRLDAGEKTRELARRIALESVDELHAAPWMLLTEDLGASSVHLYEALQEKFPEATTQAAQDAVLGGRSPSFEDYSRKRARMYYILGLIVADRADDAANMFAQGISAGDMVGISLETLSLLSRGGRSEQVWQFMHARLRQDPSLPLWDFYIQLSAQVGKSDKMIELARQAAAVPDLSPSARLVVESNLYNALFAADQVEEAIELARRIMRAPPADVPIQRAAPMSYSSSVDSEYGSASAALKLARVGLLLHRDDLVTEALDAAPELIRRHHEAQSAGGGRFVPDSDLVSQFARVCVEANRSRQAIDLLTEVIARLNRFTGDSSPYGSDSSSGSDLAVVLVEVYHRAGRHDEVLELLRTLPLFGGDDLRDLLGNYDVFALLDHGADTQIPLGYMAATAFLATGQNDAAAAVSRAMIQKSGGHDPAYKLLTDLQGDAAIPFLDETYQRDRFEERPLIWKAELLRRAKKLEEAEKCVRQAIEIDPSDGEQPRGDRMRAYAVLADILADKGDLQNAKFFREVGTAIRMAEDADRYFAAGLLTRAVAGYRKSLDHFADAYCIQSRLALQLVQLGQMEEAEKHYQRAYELMPDSFGRVESHCFGCEGVFNGELAQNVADRVFTKLVQARPDRPQVHYLLGYLRMSQQRYGDAVALYRTATKLDPDYLNAWKSLIELRDRVRLSPAEADAATLAMLRLDPLGRHASIPWQSVTDLPALWDQFARSANLQPPPIPPLLDLTASRTRRESANKPQAAFINYSMYPGRSDLPSTPQRAIAGNSLIGQLLLLIQPWG